jgi:hypothetical protein
MAELMIWTILCHLAAYAIITSVAAVLNIYET